VSEEVQKTRMKKCSDTAKQANAQENILLKFTTNVANFIRPHHRFQNEQKKAA
jgi:hypothetical protein